jgi:pseudouridine synthase
VNGEVIRTLGSKADPSKDTIKVDGRRLRFDIRPRYIVLNKPRGVVTTRKDPEGRRTVLDLLAGVREYVYPVGRLDYESEGLLLLTSDGDLAARLTHPRHAVERVYEAVVVGSPAEEDLEKLRQGVFLDGSRTAPAEVRRASAARKGTRRGAGSRSDETTLLVTLHEGRNRQVRRMCASIGHPVRKLTRVRMGPIKLGDLKLGHWRDLTPAEVAKLQHASLPSSKPAKPTVHPSTCADDEP